MYSHTCSYVRVCGRTCLYVHACVCIHVYVYSCIHTCICVWVCSHFKVRNSTDLLLFPRQRESSRKKNSYVVEVCARADLPEGSVHVVTAGTGVGAACVCSGQQLWQKAWRDRCRPIRVPGKEEAQDVGWRARFGGVKRAMKEWFALSGDSSFPWTLVGDGPSGHNSCEGDVCVLFSWGLRALCLERT